jgi:hypothetical protein
LASSGWKELFGPEASSIPVARSSILPHVSGNAVCIARWLGQIVGETIASMLWYGLPERRIFLTQINELMSRLQYMQYTTIQGVREVSKFKASMSIKTWLKTSERHKGNTAI